MVFLPSQSQSHHEVDHFCAETRASPHLAALHRATLETLFLALSAAPHTTSSAARKMAVSAENYVNAQMQGAAATAEAFVMVSLLNPAVAMQVQQHVPLHRPLC